MADKILLVVEDLVLRRELGRQLTRWGHGPVEVDDPATVMAELAHHRSPLVLLDNALDQADALEVLREIKAGEPWCEVIYLVRPDKLERGAQGLEFGASDFLVKPVSPARLGIALKRAQERLALRRELAVLSGRLAAEGAATGPDLLAPHQGAVCATRLYETQRKFEQLFNEAPCYILVVDRQFRLTTANHRYREDFGEHIGRQCWEIFTHHDELYTTECPVAHTFRDGQSRTYEEVITDRNGQQRYVLTTTAAIRDGVGEIDQVMEMSTDITQIRKLQDHLSSLGLLIGSISHGVKGLLTGLDAGMYSLRSGFQRGDQERVQQGWEVVELMVGRIKRTILDMLYYAKDRDLSLEEVDVAEFCRQVAFTGLGKARKSNVQFELRLGQDLGRFQVDPNALNPALVNLLENAVDACVEETARETHRVIFTVSREDDVVVFDVQDNGVGMDDHTQENMFTLFFTSKGSAGTGLGLFIAHDTVQQHGGSITVDSEPGYGTHFHVRIPVRPRLGARAGSSANRNPAPTPPEDEP